MSERIHVNMITRKASSKREVYCMLSLEGDVYLPPFPQANHDYVSSILGVQRKYVWLNIILVCSKQ